jgi:hypothetical protein
MALRDGLSSDEAKRRRFMLCLNELLYGTSNEESRFNAWSELLFDIDAPRWTKRTFSSWHIQIGTSSSSIS